MEKQQRFRRSSKIVRHKGYATVELSQGKVALIDIQDIDAVKEFKWHARSSRCGVFYAAYTPKGGKRYVSMHRLLAGLGGWDGTLSVDHINGNGLDNRRRNLRVANQSVQKLNERKRRDNTTGEPGVHLRPNGTWQARLAVGRKRYSLGHFDSFNQAARCMKEVRKIVKDLLSEIGTLKGDQ